jgi:hypothetical protein
MFESSLLVWICALLDGSRGTAVGETICFFFDTRDDLLDGPLVFLGNS